MKYQATIRRDEVKDKLTSSLSLYYGRETKPEIRDLKLPGESPELGIVNLTHEELEEYTLRVFVEGMRFEALDYAHCAASRLKKQLAEVEA